MAFEGIGKLIADGGFRCEACGRRHTVTLKRLEIAPGALTHAAEAVTSAGGAHPFVLCDPNTYEAAGKTVASVLDGAGVPYTLCILSASRPDPDEKTAGEAFLQMGADCDSIVGVGGGVINDISKLLARTSRLPYVYCATAPSMDGFASSSSSMELRGLKRSLPSLPAATILADTDVLAAAPRDMILSGIGDMTAKYVSLAEWKIAHVITGEFYCPVIADMVRASLERVVAHAKDALAGGRDAVADITEGLVLAGLAMNCAGVSRPASGAEHYVSHLRDMRGLAFGTRTDFHGIQCGLAVLPCLRAYESLAKTTPDRTRALAHAKSFDYAARAAELRAFAGPGAEEMIRLEAKEHKYDPAAHAVRLDRIIAHWDEITAVMATLPRADDLAAFYKSIGFPARPEDIGMTEEEESTALRFAGDIRDKYVLPRLMWDLGL